MAKKLHYENLYQFENALDNRDFKITSGIVEGVLDAMFRNKALAHIFEVSFADGSDVYYLSLNKKEWAETLRRCLPDYEKKELYEKCAEIKRAIDSLELVEKPKKSRSK